MLFSSTANCFVKANDITRLIDLKCDEKGMRINVGKTQMWVSYDLGVKGDYEGIYSCLASKNSKECGDSLAYIHSYEYQGDIDDHLRKDLVSSVQLGKRARIYVIFQRPDGRYAGKFIFGGRKEAPWREYAPGNAGDIDDEG